MFYNFGLKGGTVNAMPCIATLPSEPNSSFGRVETQNNLSLFFSATLNLLALHNKMQCYHLEVEGIPEYINMLEDAQKQAGQSGQTIADETLLLFASTAMLTTEQYPQTNDDW